MKQCYLVLLLLFVFGCSDKTQEPTSDNTEITDEMIEPNTVVEDPLVVSWQLSTSEDTDGNPLTEVKFVANGKVFPITSAYNIAQIEKSDWGNYHIPRTALTAVGGWWAGGGDYFYAEKEGNLIHILGGYADEGLPDEEQFQYEVINTIDLETLSLSTSTKTQEVATTSLCLPSEQVFMSCQVEKSSKMIAMCASKDFSRTTGYLQYRFGKPNAVELTFPTSKNNTQNQFKWQTIGYSGGWDVRVQFVNSPYTYQVYDQAYKVSMSEKEYYGGVRVLKDGKEISKIACDVDDDSYDAVLGNLFESIPEGEFFDFDD